MLDDHKQKMKEANANMEKLSGQTDDKQRPNSTPLPNIPIGHSEIGKPVAIEDREIPFHNIFRFRDPKIHGVLHIQILVEKAC